MRYIGIDVHKEYAHVTELADDGRLTSYRFRLTAEGVRGFTEQLGADAQIALEASTNSFSLYDRLERYAGRVVVVHPSQTRGASALHVKTDQADSELLARLLSVGFVRPVWVPDPRLRTLRSQVEYRRALSRDRVAVINRLRALVRQELIEDPLSGARSVKGRAFFETACFTQPGHQELAASLLRLMRALDAELAALDRALAAYSSRSPSARRLMTIPGVGPVLAAYVMAQVGDIRRFPSPAKLAAYAGLVPRVVQSGKQRFTGRISRSSRPLLRWALGQAVLHTVRYPGQLQRYHEALSSRRPKGVVKVACAHKLLTMMWHMLTHGRDYRDADPGLTRRKLSTLPESQKERQSCRRPGRVT